MKTPEHPRPRYPSDDARLRVKPHVRIHHSVSNHPKTVEVYADNDLWATWTRIMLLASERGAAHTDDRLALSKADLERVSGKRRADVALTLASRLAHVVGWFLERRGDVTVIHIRNFARKQGLTPRGGGGTPRTPHASPSPSPLRTPKEEKKQENVSRHAAEENGGEPTRPSPFDLAEAWNLIAGSNGHFAAVDLKPLAPKYETRARHELRLKPDPEYWRTVLSRIVASSFCRGERNKPGHQNWRADFTFMLRHHVEIMEGKYDDKKTQPHHARR